MHGPPPGNTLGFVSQPPNPPPPNTDFVCATLLKEVGYYRAQDLAARFSLHTLGQWRASRQIFALTSDEIAAYPAFQFAPTGVDPVVASVNAALPFSMTSTERLLWWALPDASGLTRLAGVYTHPAELLSRAQELSERWELAEAVNDVFTPPRK